MGMEGCYCEWKFVVLVYAMGLEDILGSMESNNSRIRSIYRLFLLFPLDHTMVQLGG